MLYYLVRPIAKIALSVYFRKIYISNVANLPLDKPVLLACNHPTAFVEPCILACWLPKALHFLARGDFFSNRFFRFLLRAVNIIPIFRLRDGGLSKVKTNFQSFAECHQAFQQNKLILIMAEGTSIYEKKLRPIQKGPARLVFGTLEKFPSLDLQILPVGINYTDAQKFRRNVMIDFGEAIPVQAYFDTYQQNKVAGLKSLTDRLAQDLSNLVIQIPDGVPEKTVEEQLYRIEQAHSKRLLSTAENDRTLLEKQLSFLAASKINATKQVKKETAKQVSFFKNLLWLLYPFYIAGYVLNAPPLYFAKILAAHLFPTDISFQIPVKIVLGIFAYFFWFGLVLLAITFISKSLLGWISLLPFLGAISLIYLDMQEDSR